MTYFTDNKYIESLDLSHNGMTREGLRRVKELIRTNPKLQVLNIAGNLEIDESVEMCERRMRANESHQKIIYY